MWDLWSLSLSLNWPTTGSDESLLSALYSASMSFFDGMITGEASILTLRGSWPVSSCPVDSRTSIGLLPSREA